MLRSIPRQRRTGDRQSAASVVGAGSGTTTNTTHPIVASSVRSGGDRHLVCLTTTSGPVSGSRPSYPNPILGLQNGVTVSDTDFDDRGNGSIHFENGRRTMDGVDVFIGTLLTVMLYIIVCLLLT